MALTLSGSSNRTSGVAPLYVQVDATSTTDDSTEHPFLDLFYWVDWDDAGAGSFSTTGKTKTRSIGAIASHVYETAGTKRPVLYAHNYLTRVTKAYALPEIVVSNPEVVYAGTATICFSNDSDFTGAPSGSTQVETADFEEVLSYAASDKRLLLKTDDAFDSAGVASISTAVNGVTLGKFGSGAKPLVECSGAENILAFTGATQKGDWRVMDIAFDGGLSATTWGITASGTMDQLLVLRAEFANMQIGVGITNVDPAHVWDQWAVVECSYADPASEDNSYALYGFGDRLTVMGNQFVMDPHGAHVVRIEYAAKLALNNNILTRNNPGSGHALKLHGPAWTAGSPPSGILGEGLGEGFTRWCVVSDNTAHAVTAQTMAIEPQDADHDERLKDIVVERNAFTGGAANQSAIVLSAVNAVARSNRADLTSGSNTQIVIKVAQRGIEPAPQNVRVYNESYYTGKAVPAGQFMAVQLGSTVEDITLKNIIAYAPNATTPAFLDDDGATNLTASNNSTDSQVKNTNPFVDTTDFVPQSYALTDATSDVPVYLDINGNFRGAALEMGAVEVGTEDYPEESSAGLSSEGRGRPARRTKRMFVDLTDRLVEVSGFQEAQRLLGQLKTEEKLQEKERKRLTILLGRVQDTQTGLLYETTQKQIQSLEKKMDKRDERIEKLSELILKKLEESNEDDEEVLLLS